MVQLIVGKKGKGKTKQLLDKVNGAIKTAVGQSQQRGKGYCGKYRISGQKYETYV